MWDTGSDGDFLQTPATSDDRFKELTSIPANTDLLSVAEGQFHPNKGVSPVLEKNAKHALATSYQIHVLDRA